MSITPAVASDIGIWCLRLFIAAAAGIVLGLVVAGIIIALRIGLATVSHGAAP